MIVIASIEQTGGMEEILGTFTFRIKLRDLLLIHSSIRNTYIKTWITVKVKSNFVKELVKRHWTLLVAPIYLLSSSSMVMEFLADLIIAQNKDGICQPPMQVRIASPHLWPMR